MGNREAVANIRALLDGAMSFPFGAVLSPVEGIVRTSGSLLRLTEVGQTRQIVRGLQYLHREWKAGDVVSF